ncbi:glycosyltransferase family 4 protein [Dyadobacter sp. CY323]|uniref:glycosyltransferase family 4 protein n=1 Tax=Dyadobacter sp. CY323 TaxID=2907302 RepID=UPI001F19EDF6|nr:glycosyltransferase family 4 protein [Dyadobacter sp. CY323]MCE6987721.1 glycosyltransferase family 4 protein [Dyadobacter sp. CY323]
MRILIIHNQLWAHYKSRLFSEIQQALHEKEPQSELLVAQIALHEASRAGMKNDETIRYRYPYQVLFRRSLESVGFQERLKALFTVYREYKPTVLNITGYFDMAQVALLFYARLNGVKVVISSESSPLDHTRSGWRESLKRMIVNRANGFFCFGKTSADYLESLGVKPARILVRNAAVVDENVIRANFDQARAELKNGLGISNANRTFIYVGRLAPEKNLELLIRAFDRVIKNTDTSQQWKLTLIGEGPARAALEKQVNGLNISELVHFTGGFPWHQVPAWLAKSDVLILPSKSEPWGLVVNEAMICGMPVIVSEKCGCVADLVKSEVNGFTFDPENQQELEAAMQYFIKNRENIPAMGAESMKLVAPFSSTKVAREMVAGYKKLINK